MPQLEFLSSLLHSNCNATNFSVNSCSLNYLNNKYYLTNIVGYIIKKLAPICVPIGVLFLNCGVVRCIAILSRGK